MFTLIEFHGRLSRSDKRPANPGRYDLAFQLHPTADSATALWSETLKGIDVAPGGFYYVALGQKTPLSAGLFGGAPRWLSVRVVVGGKRADEHSSRVPVLGQLMSVSEQVEQIDARIQAIEAVTLGGETGRRREGAAPTRVRDLVEELETRLSALEGQALTGGRAQQLEAVLARMDAIDGEEGRLTHIEDELEDIVGKDGDLVDLNERMDLLEDRAPDLIANLRAREGETGRERLVQMDETMRGLRERMVELDRGLTSLRAALDTLKEAPPAPPEAIGAIKKSGDTMTGGLTIQRGGLEIASGTLVGRGAELSIIEASNQVKTPKLIAESIELRGDLTVDNGKRAIQARNLEGRHSASRKDGPLFINARGGAEVVVGNAEEQKGMEVHGPLRANALDLSTTSIAVAFLGSAALHAGELVRLREDGGVARSDTASDPRVVGVLCAAPGLLLGGPLQDGRVAVAVHGVVPCLVDAEIHPVRTGDSLVSSARTGHATAATEASPPGAIFGKALEGLESGRGTVRVILWGR